MAAITAISDAVHGAYTEQPFVYRDRMALYPAGCFTLARGDDAVLGYLIGHPWRAAHPPALDTRLGAIPADADCWYLHDIALLPDARGDGAGAAAMALMEAAARAAGLEAMVLVAVNGADRYWARHGFAGAGAAPYGDGTLLMRRDLPA